MEEIVKYPFGAASEVALSATGAQAIEVVNQLTIVDGVTTQATGNRTLNLTIDEGVMKGAQLVVKTKTAATQTTIPGTGMSGKTITGVAGKTFTANYVYDGTNFVQVGLEAQID